MIKKAIEYSFATAEDFPAILSLQQANLLQNLSPENRDDGFLSVEFTLEMLAEVEEDFGIVKASCGGELVGYFMAQSLSFNQRFRLLSEIISRFSSIAYQGRKLSEARSFISGPMCVAKNWRKRGITKAMFKLLMERASEKFEIGVTFVSKLNLRSMHVSQDVLGMQAVDELEFDGKSYVIFAYKTL